MADLTVSYESLNQKSREMDQHKNNFHTLIGQAKTTIGGLSAAWKSDAQAQYEQRFHELEPTFKKFEQMLEEYAKFLKTSSDHYRAADEAVKKAAQGF
ncbi:WXG100 family type VII secretion target [Paenibacillus guangzhouensis]|uniref:WXG100 family type VII secretion target n=1 Tax=Paenibacillus guangzhouensis TaxID=1473112 RepID=UPI00187BA0FD|nr:WXG100 family type VII secretion target [Paenibacillus guangzhouensis]